MDRQAIGQVIDLPVRNTIAVIDIGKTNIKIVVFDAAAGREIDSRKAPNEIATTGLYPHHDVEHIWSFIRDSFTSMAKSHRIDAISITAHGATAVLLQQDGTLALPVLDYEHNGPDSLAVIYDALRPPFAETGSPRLPMGLNLGAQLHWQQTSFPKQFAQAKWLLMYPQYWAFRLTGKMAGEVTSLGCHTDLWCPARSDYSTLVDERSWRHLMPPLRRAADVIGKVTAEFSTSTGVATDTPVICGIHDSNASLYPHLATRSAPFAVISTGTWVICFAVGGAEIKLVPARDTLINVNALGQSVPSSRFMGGREFEILNQALSSTPTSEDKLVVLRSGTMLLPAIISGSGPFPRLQHKWINAQIATPAQCRVAASYYLALMTATCLSLIGAQGPNIVEGPFSTNPDFLDMLSAATGRPTLVSSGSNTGTSLGAAMLAGAQFVPALDEWKLAAPTELLHNYAQAWFTRSNAAGP